MSSNHQTWFVCGVIGVLLCIAKVILSKSKWRPIFIITWPIIVLLGPVGLSFAIIESSQYIPCLLRPKKS